MTLASSLLTLVLGTTAAYTPNQVKEDLDAHPWRPAPGMATVSPPAATAATKTPMAVPPATGEVWQLQVAALSSLEAAKAEQKRIEKIVGSGKTEVLTEGTVNRVRLGAYPSKEAAEAAREELRPKGIEGFPVCKP